MKKLLGALLKFLALYVILFVLFLLVVIPAKELGLFDLLYPV